MFSLRSVSQMRSPDAALESVWPRIAIGSRVSWYAIGLGCSLGLAFGLRLVGLTWGFPHEFHVDEELVVNLSQRFKGSGSLNPESSSYGALPLYLLAFASAAATQTISFLQTLLPMPIHSAPPLYVARLLSALESLATVWLTAELGRRLFGRSIALVTALLLGVCLLPVREAHFGTVDTLLLALVTLALLLGERIARRGLWKNYFQVSVAIALAAATKIVALLVLAPIALAHGWKEITGREMPLRIQWKRHLQALLVVTVLVTVLWLALNPYLLLDPDIYFNLDRNDSLHTQSLVVRGQLPVLYTLQFANETPYLYVITNLLRSAMGLPLEILALAGAGYSLWRLLCSLKFFDLARAKSIHSSETTNFADAYLLCWLFMYFFIAGSWHAQFVRYALPLIPVLCLLASRLLVDLWNGGRTARALSVALGVGVFAASLGYTLAYLQIYREPDVRLTTVAWLKGHVPAGSSILVEKDEAVFLHRSEYRKGYGLWDTDFHWRIWNPYEIDGVKSVRYQAPAVSAARTRAYLQSLLTTDYIVLSPSWRNRFLAAPELFPAQAEFYKNLFSENSGYRLMRSFKVNPRLGPLVWSDDDAEITFRMFDHPDVYVFARDAAR